MSRRTSSSPADDAADRPALWQRLLLNATLFGAGLAAGFLGPYLWVVDRWMQHEFGRLSWQIPTRVYARPLPLAPGLALTADALETELRAADYRAGDGAVPGSYARDGARFRIASRGYRDIDGEQPRRQLEVKIADGKVASLRADGKPLERARLDPARIATYYGVDREERRLVRLEDVPPLLLATLQAVEDRDFKHHVGVDWRGIVRAMWVNVREGEVRQGASTLTQQLVRDLYLSREQSWLRKAREALYAIVIEARFDKRRILEVYLNQVYLGQQGNQAVHGVAAGASFWFGRSLEQLGPAEIALLVGLVQGPSYHDPRRFPERGLARRNLVLDQMVETELLDAKTAAALKKQPLGVTESGALPSNRHPAFIAMVDAQLAEDYPADRLRGAGLTILTTLSPSAQHYAERAVAETLAALADAKRPTLQAGVVVTDTQNGEVRAVVGGRDPREPGFNRAVQAQRPVGSLLKPFVYLLALAQPGRWSLASVVDDAPISVRLSASQTWEPANSDNRSHGPVALIDALAMSYNQATVRLGIDVGVDRLSRLMGVLGGTAPPAHPSLLLGAIDQSPLQMATLYQFLASGGQVQPLRAVRGVLGTDGNALNRYDRTPEPADAGDAIAARLVTIALQYAVNHGTGRRLVGDGLGRLRPAGKTGTSNDSRDSWFAGWTGSELAVVWVGNDANEPTGLMGSTGAMRVWSALFKQMPSKPLRVGNEGLEFAWVAEDGEIETEPDCPGAREFPFVAGYTPMERRGCTFARLRDWFGGEN